MCKKDNYKQTLYFGVKYPTVGKNGLANALEERRMGMLGVNRVDVHARFMHMHYCAHFVRILGYQYIFPVPSNVFTS